MKPGSLSFAAYSPVAATDETTFARQVGRFLDSGVKTFFLSLPRAVLADGEYDHFATPFWVGDTFSAQPLTESTLPLDRMARVILDREPEAQFLIRFMPTEPESWRRLHAEELFVGVDGRREACPSLASDAYNDAIERFSAAVVAHCEAHPWADRILGYWNGLSHEGTPLQTQRARGSDRSPVMLRRWRAWLLEKYGDDGAYRAAHRSGVPLAEALTPEWKAAARYWQSPDENRALVDYFELLGQCFRETVRRLASAMRAAAGPDRLLLYDMLKMPMLGWSNEGFFDDASDWKTAFPDTLAFSGHLGVAPLLELPGVDGLITPHDYHARGLGGVYEPEGIGDSAVLRGRLNLVEMDTRTWLGRDPIAPARDAAEFAAITWRNLAVDLTRGFDSYWMDVYEDWFADAEIQRVVAAQAAARARVGATEVAPPPGIAVVLDDEAVLETDGTGAYFHEAILWHLRTSLARCGVPVRIHLLADLALPQFPEHRVFYFPNLFRCDEARLALLREKVFRPGHTVVWGPGSGISDGHRLGPESAARLTGFEFEWLEAAFPRRAIVADCSHEITARCGAGMTWGDSLPLGPCLYPRDGVSLAAAWAKRGRHLCALAAKEISEAEGGHRSVFCTTPTLPVEIWRGIARWAGAHVYSEDGVQVLAGGSWIGVHTQVAGEVRLRLPSALPVRERASGMEFPAAEELTLRFDRPGTLLFEIESS